MNYRQLHYLLDTTSPSWQYCLLLRHEGDTVERHP